MFVQSDSVWTEEDRYLYDHPGPPKITTPQPRRMVRPMIGRWQTEHWDDEQLSGQNLDDWQPEPRSTKVGTRTPYEPSGQINVDPIEHHRRYTALWLCQVCRQALALWPTEKSWMLKVFGLRMTFVFRAPIACTQCRMIEFKAVQTIGHQDYRDLWTWLLAAPWGWRWRFQCMKRRLQHYRSRIF